MKKRAEVELWASQGFIYLMSYAETQRGRGWQLLKPMNRFGFEEVLDLIPRRAIEKYMEDKS